LPPPGRSSPDSIVITHVFHPHCGLTFPLVTLRLAWAEQRVTFRDNSGKLCSIPANWTDVVPPDPVVVVSAGRSAFRLGDLVELARLVSTLRDEVSRAR